MIDQGALACGQSQGREYWWASTLEVVPEKQRASRLPSRVGADQKWSNLEALHLHRLSFLENPGGRREKGQQKELDRLWGAHAWVLCKVGDLA